MVKFGGCASSGQNLLNQDLLAAPSATAAQRSPSLGTDADNSMPSEVSFRGLPEELQMAIIDLAARCDLRQHLTRLAHLLTAF